MIECGESQRSDPHYQCEDVPGRGWVYFYHGSYRFMKPENVIEEFVCDNEDYCNAPISWAATVGPDGQIRQAKRSLPDRVRRLSKRSGLKN